MGLCGDKNIQTLEIGIHSYKFLFKYCFSICVSHKFSNVTILLHLPQVFSYFWCDFFFVWPIVYLGLCFTSFLLVVIPSYFYYDQRTYSRFTWINVPRISCKPFFLSRILEKLIFTIFSSVYVDFKKE